MKKSINKNKIKLISAGIICLSSSNTFGSEVIQGTNLSTVKGTVTSAGITTYCAPRIQVDITQIARTQLARCESFMIKPVEEQKKTIPPAAVKDFIELNLPLILEVDSEDDE